MDAAPTQRSGGCLLQHPGATKEAIEQVAWQDHEDIGEEDYP